MRNARPAAPPLAAAALLLCTLAPFAGCHGGGGKGSTPSTPSAPGAGKVLGTWVVDTGKMNLSAGGQGQPGSNAGVIEERNRKQLASLRFVFHDKKEGSVPDTDFDGLYVIQENGNDTGFGGWKSAGSQGGQSVFDMFESLSKSGSQFTAQGQFKVSGGRATWTQSVGAYGGIPLVLRKQ